VRAVSFFVIGGLIKMKRKFFQGIASVVLMMGAASIASASTVIYTEANLGDHTTDAVTINLNSLATHSQITVNFDLYIMDSWDGSTISGGAAPVDFFNFSVDGAVSSWTFDNFDLNDETNTDVADATGNFNSINQWVDVDRRFDNYNNGFTFAHSLGALELSFFGSGSGFQTIDDESWRVTNLTVSIAPVPVPGAVFLLSSALVGLAGVRLRGNKN